MKNLPRPYNFPEEWLPAVWGAIERKEVIWGQDSLVGAAGSTKFMWANALWQYDEIFERPISITLISGTPTLEDLTVAVLKGKIETS